jgi:nitroimidazol reductase NimA-like FMN-containing flavoprotein (pyridoxamine 5'-phosphate oxidase superfamily)
MRQEKPAVPGYAKIRQMNRGSYDADRARSILDAGLVGHVGFIADERPMVIPMAYAREGDRLYLHGASKTRIIKDNAEGVPMSMTVTLLDGLVVARSAFHHSVNYRCAIVHGTARLVTDEKEKEAALTAITDHLLPGRWDECRPMTAQELKATGVLALDMEHVSTKVRTGAPVDDDEDYELEIWAGVVPVVTALGQPHSDERVKPEVEAPPSVGLAKRKFA